VLSNEDIPRTAGSSCQASSIEDADSWAKDNLKTGVSLPGEHKIERMNVVLNRMKKYKDAVPGFDIKRVVSTPRDTVYAGLTTMPNGDEILEIGEVGRMDDFNLMRRFRKEQQSGYRVPGGGPVEATADHEFTHHLTNKMDLENDPVITTVHNQLQSTLTGIKNNVSGLAAKDKHEFIAECWTEGINAYRPRKTAVAVTDRILAKINVKRECAGLAPITREYFWGG